MRKLIFAAIFMAATCATAQTNPDMKTLHDFKTETLEGEEFDFSTLKGKKVLIVNTASKCGLTPQYEGLENVYQQFKDSNFVIVGFPANNFAGQEPGSNEEIGEFCQRNYGVSFPMMSKISVKGEDQHPIYQWLTKQEMNGVENYEVKWNFHKFLIDENGKLVKDVDPRTEPESEEIINWIKQ